MTEGIYNKLTEAIEEKVTYQNPLLFFKGMGHCYGNFLL